jgi:hypothetical protein
MLNGDLFGNLDKHLCLKEFERTFVIPNLQKATNNNKCSAVETIIKI